MTTLMWNERITIIQRNVKLESVVVLEYHRGLEPPFNLLRENKGLLSIITTQPSSILPKHVSVFYYTLRAMKIDIVQKR